VGSAAPKPQTEAQTSGHLGINKIDRDLLNWVATNPGKSGMDEAERDQLCRLEQQAYLWSRPGRSIRGIPVPFRQYFRTDKPLPRER
jgi:hypothetical protein